MSTFDLVKIKEKYPTVQAMSPSFMFDGDYENCEFVLFFKGRMIGSSLNTPEQIIERIEGILEMRGR